MQNSKLIEDMSTIYQMAVLCDMNELCWWLQYDAQLMFMFLAIYNIGAKSEILSAYWIVKC
jgi:hypothetical protein